MNNKIVGILFYFKYKYNMPFKDLKIFRKYFKTAFMIDEYANDKFMNFRMLDNIAKSYSVVTLNDAIFDKLINLPKDNSNIENVSRLCTNITTFIYNPTTILVFAVDTDYPCVGLL